MFHSKKDVENRVPLLQITDSRVFNILKDTGSSCHGDQGTKTGTEEDEDDQWSDRSHNNDLLDRDNRKCFTSHADV